MMLAAVIFSSIVSVALSINNYAAFQSTEETGESVACPVKCHASNIETCFNTTTTCNGQLDFCQLSLTPMGNISGTCLSLTSHSICTDQQIHSPCDNNPNNPTSNCVLSCCASLLCMQMNQYNGLTLASHMYQVSHNVTVTHVIPLENVSRPRSDLVASLAVTGEPLFCPVKCDVTNVQSCFNNTVQCDGSHSYCHIMLDVQGVIRGFCAKSDNGGHNTCFSEAIRSQCQQMYTVGSSACVLSCCQSQNCLTSSTTNGLTYATLLLASALLPTLPPTTTATTTTTMVTTTQTTTAKPTTTTTTPTTTTTLAPEQSLYEKFANSCQDQLESGACAVLKANEGVCQNVLSIELCADTCGVCKVIADANCHDIVLNNGCQDQYVGRGICGDFMAKYTCPESCGLCDSLVGKLLLDLLKTPAKTKPTKPTRTTLPPTTVKPTTAKPTTVKPTTLKPTTTQKPTTINPGVGDLDIDIG